MCSKWCSKVSHGADAHMWGQVVAQVPNVPKIQGKNRKGLRIVQKSKNRITLKDLTLTKHAFYLQSQLRLWRGISSIHPASELHSQTFFLNQPHRVETLTLANQKWPVPDYTCDVFSCCKALCASLFISVRLHFFIAPSKLRAAMHKFTPELAERHVETVVVLPCPSPSGMLGRRARRVQWVAPPLARRPSR